MLAALVGTLELLELLEPDERARVAAFVINKFRGDKVLLDPALEFLERRTGKPVLGVVPYIDGLRIADEDCLGLEGRRGHGTVAHDAGSAQHAAAAPLDIAVVRLPRISNFDDLLPLEREPLARVRFVTDARELAGADLVVLPGSKTTALDLAWLRARGLGAAVQRRAESGGLVLGICGGCQMLGHWVHDPDGVESTEPSAQGLGLLGISTHFRPHKLTAQVKARPVAPSFLISEPDAELSAYEIQMGEVTRHEGAPAAFQVTSRNGSGADCLDGAVNSAGNVLGTLLHGIFDNAALRASLLANLLARRGDPAGAAYAQRQGSDDEYDRLATVVRESVDMRLLYRLARLR